MPPAALTFTSRIKARFFIRLAGMVLMAVACLYVGWQISQKPETLSAILSLHALPYILAGLATTATSELCIALAWAYIVNGVSNGIARLRLCAIFITSQIGKYIPGNVFQYAGCYALGLRAGLSQADLASGLILEPIMLVSMACILAPLLGGRGLLNWVGAHPAFFHVFFYTGACCIVVLIVLILLSIKFDILRFVFSKARLLIKTVHNRVRPHAIFLTCLSIGYLLFQACSALIALSFSGWSLSDGHICAVMAAAIASWAIGYIVPGAPGGIGIREFMMIQLLPFVPRTIVIQAVIFWRLLSLLYDVLAFGAGSIILDRYASRDDRRA